MFDKEYKKEDKISNFFGQITIFIRQSSKNEIPGKTTLSKVAPDFIALYEKIRTSNNGTGAAALIAGACNGCHLSINAVELKRIIDVAEDEVIRCEECRCILVRGV